MFPNLNPSPGMQCLISVYNHARSARPLSLHPSFPHLSFSHIDTDMGWFNDDSDQAAAYETVRAPTTLHTCQSLDSSYCLSY